MKFAALISGTVVLAGCASPSQPLPPGVSQTDIATYRAAVTAAGCTIENDTQAAPVEARTGFDDDKLGDITDYLAVEGELQFTANGIRLTSGPCTNA